MAGDRSSPGVVGSALVWTVKSDDPEKEPYRVELDSYSGNGECTCPHFNARLRPQLARGAKASDLAWNWMGLNSPNPRDAYRCKHIIDARLALVDRTVEAFAQAKRSHPSSA